MVAATHSAGTGDQSTAGKSPGRKSQSDPLTEVIAVKVEAGLSAQPN